MPKPLHRKQSQNVKDPKIIKKMEYYVILTICSWNQYEDLKMSKENLYQESRYSTGFSTFKIGTLNKRCCTTMFLSQMSFLNLFAHNVNLVIWSVCTKKYISSNNHLVEITRQLRNIIAM